MKLRLALILIGLVGVLSSLSPAHADEPVVRAVLFYSESCPHCQVVLSEVLPPLQARHGSHLEIRTVEISTPDNYAMLLRMEEAYRVPPDRATVPELFAAEQVLFGEHEIRDRLPLLVEELLAQGGTDWPAGLDATPTPSAREPKACHTCDEEASAGDRAVDAPEEPNPPVHLAYFYQMGCHDCDRARHDLRYLATGAEAYWASQADLAAGEAGILQRFQSFGALTVVAAGLIDGLNPCAFATIVFFISYLSFAGRKGREILLVGAMFALGVFLTYLGVGIGLLKFLAALPFLPAVSRNLYGLTAVLCLILALGSLYDWYQMRRGRPEEMRLKLPVCLRRQINRVIREGANVRAIAGVALVTGAVISLIELACTGQVYLPTILLVLGVPALRVRALLYLVLYNTLFVLPLVVVFLLAYWGTTSERLAQFVNRRTGVVKLATAGLFLLLGGWMATML